ncbi:placenta-specific protein 9 isoform X1 [Oncorhynchus kisutch]|uniref:placenta-specific protein 9 isoform X1 n=1 Tax=Oncorhynchus kisutch TaxID=8019 RepID=UPI0012DC8FA0|nr:placenta-specific protein 9 isoform X1 [Oncorhynchus kisutch]
MKIYNGTQAVDRDSRQKYTVHSQAEGDFAVLGPESELQPRAVRSSACQDHSTLHDRLDVVEKRVEDTVQKLEDELAVLLDAIEAPEWSPLLETAGKPVVDILDGQGLGEGGDS